MHKVYDTRWKHILIYFFVCLFSQFAVLPWSLPQAQISHQEELTKLNVLVIDSQNRPIMDLKREDFHIFEDETPQTISYFSKDELPLNYCIVLDTSGSAKKYNHQTISAAQTIVRNNKPSDETALIEFKDAAELVEEFTSSKDAILRSLDTLRGRSSRPTTMIDAVYVATQYVAEYKPVDRLSRRALIVISDGDDRISYHKVESLRKLLRKENIQVFAIGYDVNEIGKIHGKGRQKKAVELLTEITKETGGQAYFPHNEAELQEIAKQVLPTLRAQYVIGYKPAENKKKGAYHSVKVIVVDVPGQAKRIAITRAGYIQEDRK